jgi:hypothetical protein
MRVLVTESFNTAKGNIPEGKVIDIPDTMFNRLKGKVVAIPPVVNNKASAEMNAPTKKIEPGAPAGAIWVNPFPQGSMEARRESILQCMDAIWEQTFDRTKAIWPLGFVSTPEIRTAEIEIERVQALVISGKGKIADFRLAVEAWERMIKQGVNDEL